MPQRFYITTAIDYVNGRPHIGHAYEKILADAVARFHRQRGDATYFLTGTDEHGQKVARAAGEAGKDPKTFADENAAHFKAAWKALGLSYDKFIRTTDQRHVLAVQELFRRLHGARSPKTGEPVLFEESYEGLYCEGCEAFKLEKDLTPEGRCPEHDTVPRRGCWQRLTCDQCGDDERQSDHGRRTGHEVGQWRRQIVAIVESMRPRHAGQSGRSHGRKTRAHKDPARAGHFGRTSRVASRGP